MKYETLRLYTPVESVSRSTSTPQSVTTSFGSYVIPEDTDILVSLGHVHTKDPHWGTDAFTFRPSRWIEEDSSVTTRVLMDAPPGVFIPWSAEAKVW